jgi:hypothetical protein
MRECPFACFGSLAPAVLPRNYFDLVSAASFRSVSDAGRFHARDLAVALSVFSAPPANSVLSCQPLPALKRHFTH